MPFDQRPIDPERVFEKTSLLSVYVPPKPEPKPGDWKLDFPPGFPPEVHYFDVKANYWIVLREREMPYGASSHKFNEEDMEWLRSIRSEVEKLLRE